MPPSWAYWFGTTSRGQDVFWQLTFAIRNTLLFGMPVALLSRCLSLADRADRRLRRRLGRPRADVDQRHLHRHPAVPDPGAVLFRDARPACPGCCWRWSMACLGWAYDARLIRSVALSLRTREFTETGIFSGMTHARDPAAGASALRAADRVLDHDEQHELVDRPGGDAVGAGLHRHQHADHRRA